MTVLEGIKRSGEFLTRKGVDSPRLQAELLLAHVLKMERMKLYLEFERQLSGEEEDRYRELVKRRGAREPLQQIVGSACFCGAEIAVNRHVLVPRPETELLAEQGWKRLLSSQESRVTSQKSYPEALDLGTGSGCLAIAIAGQCPGVKVVATDVSTEALEVAKGNAERNRARIDFRLGNGFEALKPDERFDLIVSNPPYIPSAEIGSLQPEVKDWEPRGALDGGADGLDWYRRIAAEARPFLKVEGRVMVEFGDGQAEQIRKIFEEEKWIVEAVVEDYTRRPRILVAGGDKSY